MKIKIGMLVTLMLSALSLTGCGVQITLLPAGQNLGNGRLTGPVTGPLPGPAPAPVPVPRPVPTPGPGFISKLTEDQRRQKIADIDSELASKHAQQDREREIIGKFSADIDAIRAKPEPEQRDIDQIAHFQTGISQAQQRLTALGQETQLIEDRKARVANRLADD